LSQELDGLLFNEKRHETEHFRAPSQKQELGENHNSAALNTQILCDILAPVTGPSLRTSAYYSAPVDRFLTTDKHHVLGALAAAHTHDLEVDQRQAWEEEIEILGRALSGLEGTIFLEFDVPRLGSRIDAVLVSGPTIFAIEFKCGERQFRLADYNQAWDYALDLKNFHAASHDAPICPILVATQVEVADDTWQPAYPDGVRPPYRCGALHLRRCLEDGLTQCNGPQIDGESWGAAPYQPTPTIIEAARALYARHSVEAISRHDAGARNLRVTSLGVEEIIDRTRGNREKAIVFATGVPGAGKTLVGLNVATRRQTFGEARAVYLSGNGPLVAFISEVMDVLDERLNPLPHSAFPFSVPNACQLVARDGSHNDRTVRSRRHLR
jgi:hypothetical protein